MQFIQDTNAGGRIGEAFGTGLQQLAQGKLQMLMQPYQQAIERQQFSQGVEPLLGPDVTKFLAGLDPASRKAALQNLGPLVQLSQMGGVQGILGGQGGGMQQLAGQQNQQGGIPIPGGQPATQPGQEIPNTGVLSPELLQQIKQQQGQPQQQQQGADRAKILEDIFTPPALKIQKEMLELKRMKGLEKPLGKIEDAGRIARTLRKTAEDALSLLQSGKAITGKLGRITPEFLQTQEGQELITKLKQIVIQRSQLGKGVPSAVRLGLEEGAKAAIWHNPNVIRNILKDTINDPEVVRDITRDDARESLLQKYGEKIPTDLVSQIDKLAKTSPKAASSSQYTKASLPDASQYAEGSKAKNPNTGKAEYVVKDGKWEKI